MPEANLQEHLYSSSLDQKAFHNMNTEHFVDASTLGMYSVNTHF